MKIAAAVNENKIRTVIPETLDEAQALLIYETDTMDILDYVTERDAWVDQMDAHGCEAILCGTISDAALFEKIASACITRFYAGDMSVLKATARMLDDELELIRDYVGGTGCSSHGTGTPYSGYGNA